MTTSGNYKITFGAGTRLQVLTSEYYKQYRLYLKVIDVWGAKEGKIRKTLIITHGGKNDYYLKWKFWATLLWTGEMKESSEAHQNGLCSHTKRTVLPSGKKNIYLLKTLRDSSKHRNSVFFILLKLYYHSTFFTHFFYPSLCLSPLSNFIWTSIL